MLERDGTISQTVRNPTPQADYSATLQMIRESVESLSIDAECPVGIGTPGSLSAASGLMRNSNSTCLNGMPLDRDLEQCLKRPVRLANDANCFALSEARDGAAAGARNVFGVILGTGVGGGICIDGALLAGTNGISGEWGHNPIPSAALAAATKLGLASGRQCYCGATDCVET